MADKRLAERAGEALKARGWMFCAAESCTGGLLTHELTNIAGSSAYVIGGIVAYSYEAKERLLNVRHDTLTQYGAVSEQTALEMVQGVLAALDGDIGISITGIAGPGGGMPNKPVGLTYIAIAVPSLGILRVDRHVWSGDRETIKACSATEALHKILVVAENGYQANAENC